MVKDLLLSMNMLIPLKSMLPFNDLQPTSLQLKHDIDHAIQRVTQSGCYVLGAEVAAFEAEFAAYCSTDYCIGVANGTDALELSLRALKIKPDDSVATVANAGMYSSCAIHAIGAKAIYVEVDPQNMTMDPQHLERIIHPQLKAIVVTHLYGQMADMPAICKIANEYEIPIIEDCAHAHGAILQGKKAGSWGTLGCFSFYPTKNLGACGDGGAIVTSNPQLAENIKILRQYGWEKKYHIALSGGRNSRLDELQAAILRVKLPYLDQWNQQRRKIAAAYNNALRHLNLTLPSTFDTSYVAHLYVVRSPQRNQLRELLRTHNINTEIHYPIPDYLQSVITANTVTQLPITEKCCNEVLSLPCYPSITEKQIQYMIETLLCAYDENID
jgi:aminotransferase EvaB